MFQKVLVANRGEIACRVIRTCQKLGISTVAIYAEGDAEAPFVKEADTAFALNGRTSAETYLDIEKVRFSDRLSVELNVADDAYRCSVPSLILQPIVENAIKYAIARSEDGGTIRVSAECSGDVLVMTVDDTGPGLERPPAEQQRDADESEGVGIGLQNIRERLMTLYGGQAEVSNEHSELGGRTVRIVLPAAVHYEEAS